MKNHEKHRSLIYYKNVGRTCYVSLSFCRVTFPNPKPSLKRKAADDGAGDTGEASTTDQDTAIIVEPHIIPNRGPYMYSQPKRSEMESLRY